MVALALALLLLPGLLVVRAPWPAVPALSLAFWVVSAPWLPARASRSGFVAGALVFFAFLALLRLLPKHEVEPPPGFPPPPRREPPARPGLAPPILWSMPSMLVICAAAVLLLQAGLWSYAPGPELAFETTAAQLVLWRDALPLSAEPLLPLTRFTGHAPGFSVLAADVAAVSALDAARAVAVVLAAAAALLPLGLFSLIALRLPPPLAATAAVLAPALVPWPGWLSLWAAGPALLALALVLPAAALLLGHASRSSAWAAALLFAAGLLSHPLLALVVLAVATALGALRSPPARARFAAVAAGAVALAAPTLLRAAGTVSRRESIRLLTSGSGREWLEWSVGAGVLLLVPLVLARWPIAVSAGPFAVLARRGLVVLGLLGVTLLGLRHGAWMAEGRLTKAERAWLALARAVDPLEIVCTPEESGAWWPALAGRALEPPPWTPVVYRDELSPAIPRRCRTLQPSGR